MKIDNLPSHIFKAVVVVLLGFNLYETINLREELGWERSTSFRILNTAEIAADYAKRAEQSANDAVKQCY